MRYKNLITLGTLALGLTLSACDSDDGGGGGSQAPGSEDPGNLVEVATEAGLTDLVAALETAELTEAVSTTENLTVFAPTNDALADVTLPEDPDLLANVLLYHVIGSELDAEAVTAAETLTTLANIDLPKDGTTIAGVDISDGTLDVAASNGIAHVINGVFVPPTIAEAVAATEDLSTLATVTASASDAITGALGGDGPITVFAPNNAAFAALLEAVGGELPPQDVVDNILAYHVVNGQILSSDIEAGEVTTVQGATFEVSTENDTITLTDGQGNEVGVTETIDLRLLNGVVHIIDGVLLPPDETNELPTIAQIVQTSTSPTFSSIVQAAISTGLAEDFSDPDADFTVFAPTDEAFDALRAGLGEPQATWLDDTALLANVLLHHVVEGTQDADTVLAAESFTSLAETPLPVVVGDDGATIGGAPLSDTLNLEASNGIVHAIDGVMVPPTILEIAGATEDVSTLVQVVGDLNNETINGVLASGPITVFAPTNEAFEDLGDDAPTGDELANVVSYHALLEQVVVTEGSATFETAQGSELTINVADDGSITVTDSTDTPATVRGAVFGFNGVVYLVDKVLIPPAAQ